MDRVVAAALVAALLAASAPVVADGGDDPVEVQVRIEGPADHGTIWIGNVTLSGTYELTADTSGETYTLDQKTPLGALHAAAEKADLDLQVSDDFASSDFTVQAIDRCWADGIFWWSYRVNWVKTYYGNQRGWVQYGPGLEDGDRILWYMKTTGSKPLKLSGTAQAPPGPTRRAPDGAAAFRVEWPVADPSHRPGKPWPTLAWGPAPATEIVGDVDAPAPAGAAVVPLEEGAYRSKAIADDAWPLHTVRSNPVTVVVD